MKVYPMPRGGKGGRKKPVKRLDLENADLIALLSNNSIKDIAIMFKTSKYMVSNAIESQFKDRMLTFKEYHNLKKANDEMDLECQGAWMNSLEREQLKQS